MKRIMILGKNGQLGWELHRSLSTLGEIHAFSKVDLDLSNPSTIRSMVQAIRPHIIVNAAAYTAVDKAESENVLATRVNSNAALVLAEEAKRSGAILIHFSTDYVFDGKSTTPYTEKAITSPLNVYGKTKLAGEEAIQNSGCKYLIFRTSWIYSNRGKNFFLTMLNLARNRQSLSVVNDQLGAPTWARILAEATSQILYQVMYSSLSSDSVWGLYHMTAAEYTSWFGFAHAIFEQYHLTDSSFVIPEVKPITTAEYPTPAQRPLYSILDNSKLQDVFHVKLPSWKHSLELCIADRILQ